MKKNEMLIRMGTFMTVFAVGYVCGRSSIVKNRYSAHQQKVIEVGQLYIELLEYMSSNLSDRSVSEEEYKKVVDEKIKFIETIKSM